MIYILQLTIEDIDYHNSNVLAASDSPSLLGRIKDNIVELVKSKDAYKLKEYLSDKYTYIPNPRVSIDIDSSSPENIVKDLIVFGSGENDKPEELLEIKPVDYFVV